MSAAIVSGKVWLQDVQAKRAVMNEVLQHAHNISMAAALAFEELIGVRVLGLNRLITLQRSVWIGSVDWQRVRFECLGSKFGGCAANESGVEACYCREKWTSEHVNCRDGGECEGGRC